MKKNGFIELIAIVANRCCQITESFAIAAETEAQEQAPNILAEAAVVMDAKSGEVLYEKNADEIKEMASTTKIMTALVVLENIPLDTVVTVDAQAAAVEGAGIGLQVGEEISVRELLYALFLKSANDSAIALAKAAGGSMENFVEMMNQKCEQLGLENTNFKNPHGLHDDGHYTSARDLAILSKVAMQYDTIRTCAGTISHTIPKTNVSEARHLKNINHLLFDSKKEVEVNGSMRSVKYEGICGLKTGYTQEAKNCISAVCKRGDSEYIVTLLGSSKDGKYADTIALLDWAFAHFSSIKIMDYMQGEALPIKMGKNKKTKAVVQQDVYVSIPKSADASKINYTIEPIENLEAPIERNQRIGDLKIYYEGELLKIVPTYAKDSNERGGVVSFLRNLFAVRSLVWVLAIAIFALFLKLYANRKKRIEEEREEERKRKALEIEMERVHRNMQRFARYK